MDADRFVDQEHEKLKKQLERDSQKNDEDLARRIQLRDNLKKGADTPDRPDPERPYKPPSYITGKRG